MRRRKEDDYKKICLFCENASIINGNEEVLCHIHGVVREDYCCRRYIYDPLKRTPVSPQKLEGLAKEDLI